MFSVKVGAVPMYSIGTIVLLPEVTRANFLCLLAVYPSYRHDTARSLHVVDGKFPLNKAVNIFFFHCKFGHFNMEVSGG